jgi:hypothetical protein
MSKRSISVFKNIKGSKTVKVSVRGYGLLTIDNPDYQINISQDGRFAITFDTGKFHCGKWLQFNI